MNLEIERPAQWADMTRNYEILIDGKKVAEIGRGEKIQLEVPDTTYSVQARIDWCTSNCMTLRANSNKLIVRNSFSGNPLKWLFVIYYISFGRNKYLELVS